MDKKTVSILGCGWFGLPFAKALVAQGYQVNGSCTSAEKVAVLTKAGIQAYLIDLNTDENLPLDFFEVDTLFICVPPRAKTASSELYLAKMKRVQVCAAKRSKTVVFISSTGVFEDGNTEFTELSVPKPNTPAGKVLFEVEQLFLSSQSFNSVVIRFAGLIGQDRNLAKFFAGKTDAPNGNAPINLITLDDCVGFCLSALACKGLNGIYHAVAPHHPSRALFYTKLCEKSGMLKPVFNDELLPWKQVNSVRATSELNYHFIVKNWFDWLDTNPVL